MELMSENVRAAMCYTLGFITGVLFLFDGSPFVRFHAVQSTLTFSTISALIILLPVIPGGVMLSRIVMAFSLLLWAICIIKASRGEVFKLPIFGEIAEAQITPLHT